GRVLCRGARAGFDHADDRDRQFLLERGQCVRACRVARDHDCFDVFLEQEMGDLARETRHAFFGLVAIRQPGHIAEIEQLFVGQQAQQLTKYGEPTDPRVEHSKWPRVVFHRHSDTSRGPSRRTCPPSVSSGKPPAVTLTCDSPGTFAASVRRSEDTSSCSAVEPPRNPLRRLVEKSRYNPPPG